MAKQKSKSTPKQNKEERTIKTYPARIVRSFDGDTFTAHVNLGLGFSGTVQFNLANADAHELRGESLESGRFAKEAVQNLMMGKEVIIRTDESKLKGRYAATVEIDGEDLGNKLVADGHATPIE